MIFLGGYLPAKGYGGPVTSVANFAAHLGSVFDIYIVASDHDFGKTTPIPGIPSGWNRVGPCSVRYLPESEFTRTRFRQLLEEIRPDMMYMSSIFHHRMNYPLQREAKRLGIPVVLCPRGELHPDALRRSALKKRAYYTLMRVTGHYRRLYFHTTCDSETDAVLRLLKADPDRVRQLPNFPAKREEKPNTEKRPDSLRVMVCARILPNKNQLTAIEAVKQLSFPTVCDIYGPIEDEAYWEQCRLAMAGAPGYIQFYYGGLLSSEQVGEELLRHDCFLLPTAFENFGHSICEALLHDCPVVISRGTTPWDDVQQAGCGWTVPPEAPEGYAKALSELGAMNTAAYSALIRRLRDYCAERFHPEELKQAYCAWFDRVITGRNT